MSPTAEEIAHSVPSFTGQLLQPADVVDAVQLARSAGLEVSVRGGDHNVGGRAVVDGGLMTSTTPRISSTTT